MQRQLVLTLLSAGMLALPSQAFAGDFGRLFGRQRANNHRQTFHHFTCPPPATSSACPPKVNSPTEPMVMQTFEEQVTVKVPKTVIENGVTKTVIVEEIKTKQVQRAVPLSQVIKELEAKVSQPNIGETIDLLNEIIDKLRKIQPQEQSSLKSIEDEIKKLKEAVEKP